MDKARISLLGPLKVELGLKLGQTVDLDKPRIDLLGQLNIILRQNMDNEWIWINNG